MNGSLKFRQVGKSGFALFLRVSFVFHNNVSGSLLNKTEKYDTCIIENIVQTENTYKWCPRCPINFKSLNIKTTGIKQQRNMSKHQKQNPYRKTMSCDQFTTYNNIM